MTGPLSHYVDSERPWDGALYAANTAHHRRYDDAFLETLPLRATDRVIDVGCGSGDFTAQVAARVPAGTVLGVDPEASMVAEAEKRAGPNQSFALAPAQALGSVVAAGSADVVMSRAALHWVPEADHDRVFAEFLAALRPGGTLRVECGGGDNVREVAAFLDDVAAGFGRPRGTPWAFVAAGAALDRLLAVGFEVAEGFGWVRTVAQRRAFDRPSVLGWLHSQCLQAYEAALPEAAHDEFRSEAERRVDELRRPDGSYDLTFVRLDVLARRPG